MLKAHSFQTINWKLLNIDLAESLQQRRMFSKGNHKFGSSSFSLELLKIQQFSTQVEARKTLAKQINVSLKYKPTRLFNRRNFYLIKTENTTPFSLTLSLLKFNGKKPGDRLHRLFSLLGNSPAILTVIRRYQTDKNSSL